MSTGNIENMSPIRRVDTASSSKEAVKGKLGGGGGVEGNRKKLQTLQPSARNQKVLVGSDGLLRLSGGKKKEPVKVYQDPPLARSTPERKEEPAHNCKNTAVQATVHTATIETQVDPVELERLQDEANMYLGEADLPITYWKDLAEKRREALEQSLVENEELHTSLGLLEEEKGKLEEERNSFRNMAEQAEELAKIVRDLTADEDDSDDEVANDSSVVTDDDKVLQALNENSVSDEDGNDGEKEVKTDKQNTD